MEKTELNVKFKCQRNRYLFILALGAALVSALVISGTVLIAYGNYQASGKVPGNFILGAMLFVIANSIYILRTSIIILLNREKFDIWVTDEYLMFKRFIFAKMIPISSINSVVIGNSMEYFLGGLNNKMMNREILLDIDGSITVLKDFTNKDKLINELAAKGISVSDLESLYRYN